MLSTTASDFLGPIRYPYSMSPHVASHPYRLDEAPRKRPKYTRSKTGCLTCRAKKVKVRAIVHFEWIKDANAATVR